MCLIVEMLQVLLFKMKSQISVSGQTHQQRMLIEYTYTKYKCTHKHTFKHVNVCMYTLLHILFKKKFWPEEKMYYNRILRLINTDVQKTFFYFHLFNEFSRNTIRKAHASYLGITYECAFTYMYTRVCIHTVIYVYI